MRLTRRKILAGLGGVAVLGAVPSARALNGVHHVEIRNFAFEPPTVLAKAGEIVEWSNFDIAPHTATDAGGAWDTSYLEKGSAARVTFDAPGRHQYFCAYHPAMKGEIIVE